MMEGDEPCVAKRDDEHLRFVLADGPGELNGHPCLQILSRSIMHDAQESLGVAARVAHWLALAGTRF